MHTSAIAARAERAEPAIRVRELTKYYGARAAVRDLSFSVDRGAVVGVLGLNGAGKSTTLRVLGGVLLPTGGEVEVDGLDLAGASREVRRRVGYLPESPPAYPEMPVSSFLTYLARLRGVPARHVRGRVLDAEHRCGLAAVHGERIATLSHGYRQRVGLAQTLVHRPSVLVLDEPTKGLDPQQIVEMRHLIDALRGEHTILVSSHILTEISRVCDRLLAIHRGRLVAHGTEAELSRELGAHETVELEVRGARDAIDRALAEVGLVADRVTPSGERVAVSLVARHARQPEIVRALVGQGIDVFRVGTAARLEALFLELTREVVA